MWANIRYLPCGILPYTIVKFYFFYRIKYTIVELEYSVSSFVLCYSDSFSRFYDEFLLMYYFETTRQNKFVLTNVVGKTNCATFYASVFDL